jgi:hypothetical protein
LPRVEHEPSATGEGRSARHDRPPNFRADIERAWEILGRLNALPPGDFDAMRTHLSELTGREIDPSVRVLPPFHTDTGRNLRFGRNVFVNHGCTAMDLGGIDIGDDVMIGPNVQLISSGHPLDPATRRRSITDRPDPHRPRRVDRRRRDGPAGRHGRRRRRRRRRAPSSRRTSRRARWSPASPHGSSARSRGGWSATQPVQTRVEASNPEVWASRTRRPRLPRTAQRRRELSPEESAGR